MWPEREGGPDLLGSAFAKAGGLPDANEIMARYAAQSARNLSPINWYVALACFRLGILLEGTYARALAGQADMTVGEQFHRHTVALFDRAQRVVRGESEISRHS